MRKNSILMPWEKDYEQTLRKKNVFLCVIIGVLIGIFFVFFAVEENVSYADDSYDDRNFKSEYVRILKEQNSILKDINISLKTLKKIRVECDCRR